MALHENTFQDIRLQLVSSNAKKLYAVHCVQFFSIRGEWSICRRRDNDKSSSKATKPYAMSSRMAQSDRDKVPRCHEMKVKGQTSNSRYQVTESPEDARELACTMMVSIFFPDIAWKGISNYRQTRNQNSSKPINVLAIKKKSSLIFHVPPTCGKIKQIRSKVIRSLHFQKNI